MTRRPGKRGFLLVMALFLMVILLITGVSLLGRCSLQYRGAALSRHTVQARFLAEAGLEDARVKLEKDLGFPHVAGEEQPQLLYSEAVSGPDWQGRYTVSVDMTWRAPPYSIVRVTSTGSVFQDGQVLARRTLVAELDVSPDRSRTLPSPQETSWFRDNLAEVNPGYFQYTSFQDMGSL